MPKLLSTLPVGAVVKDIGTVYNGKHILFKVMEHNHDGDPEGSTALITKKIITLKCFDARESTNSNSGYQKYGYGYWKYANLRQWLNSTEATGRWYTAQHNADAPPTNSNIKENCNEYYQESGFLTNFSEKFCNKLLIATKRVAKNTVTDGGGYEDVTDKIFLLSNTELGLANENSIPEGSIYALFRTTDERISYPTAEAVSQSEYKNRDLKENSVWYWWLRTGCYNEGYKGRIVTMGGFLSKEEAHSGVCGVRPACIVPSSIIVSDTADTDGAYTMIWNNSPTITTDSTENLGDKNASFIINYTITDPDNDKVTAVIKLDTELVETLDNIVLGQAYEINISVKKLNELTTGVHTITITAQDSHGNANTKTITFNKTAASVMISGTDEAIGNWWMIPQYTYNVADTQGKQITVTESVDGEITNTIENAGQQGTITFKMDEVFDTLENESTHTMTIKAVNADGAEIYRYITFTKLASALCFETRPLETDAGAEKILVIINYAKQGNPALKVEVTNCAYNEAVIWEDATEAVLEKNVYTFQNKTFDSGRYGVAIRVTVTKNEDTERVYCNSLGFCFD